MLKPVRSLKEHWFYGPVFKAKDVLNHPPIW